MAPAAFQFRLCLNPECGLRFPAATNNRAGERCPRCLGRTIVVAESTAGGEAAIDEGRGIDRHGLEALLDNVRSALNVGAIFRAADGYGLRHLYLGGITPTPENARVRKTALGAEQTVEGSAHKNGVELVASLKAHGRCIWALERTANSRPIEAIHVRAAQDNRCVLVVGNEQAGVDPGILDRADEIVHLEMLGRKQSFNVAIAFAIAAFVLSREEG
jgi:tRNA G18 (ribose-2'-O)-methylase SpoU